MPVTRSSSCRMALSAFIVLWPLQGLAESAWNGPVPLRDIPMPPPQQRYPAKNTSTVKEAYSHTAEWEGRAVAMEGTIKSIEVDDRGHPSIELLLAQDGAMTIWATWPLTNTKGMDSFLRVGERLRVLGWLRDSVAWAKVTHLGLPRQNPMTATLPEAPAMARAAAIVSATSDTPASKS